MAEAAVEDADEAVGEGSQGALWVSPLARRSS